MSSTQLRTTLSKPVALARLAALSRVLLLRLFVCHVKQYLRSYIQKWHVAASVLHYLQAPTNPRSATRKLSDVPRTVATLKAKIHPPKVEIKTVRTLEQKSAPLSPSVSTKKISLSATMKLSSKTNKSVKLAEKSESAATESKVVEFEMKKPAPLQGKRPTSVPPIREDPSDSEVQEGASHAHGEDKPPLSGLMKTPRGKSAQRATPDVCTRLFNEAQERETKRAEMRKSLEPDYSFTPRLALGTNKWLSQKSAKSTPMKTRGKVEEIAVVSSAAVLSSLGRIGEMITPKVKEQLKLSNARGQKSVRVPVIPLMPQDTLVEEVEELLSDERYGKKCSPFSLTYSQEDLQYETFGARIDRERADGRSISPIHKAGASLNSPSFIKKENLGEISDVFIDFTGEDSFLADKSDLPA